MQALTKWATQDGVAARVNGPVAFANEVFAAFGSKSLPSHQHGTAVQNSSSGRTYTKKKKNVRNFVSVHTELYKRERQVQKRLHAKS